MMNSYKTVTIIFSTAALVAGLTACQKNDVTAEQKGPAETAGKQLDQASSGGSRQRARESRRKTSKRCTGRTEKR
jgi:hypothetical protein